MTNVDHDTVVESYLRWRGEAELPADLLDSVVTEARMTGQVPRGINWPVATLGVAAAAVFMGIAFIGLDRGGPPGVPSALASPTSTPPASMAIPTAQPHEVSPSPTDDSSPFELVEGPSICQSDDFSVYVPHGWYTHETTAGTGCQQFATEAFPDGNPRDTRLPRITFQVMAMSGNEVRGQYGDEGALREITFSGLPAIRWESTAEEDQHEDARLGVQYSVFLGGDGSLESGTLQRVLRASYTGVASQDEIHRAAFLGMLGSIVMLDGTMQAAREAEVERLFAATDVCHRRDVLLSVEFPDEWYSNTEVGPVPACMYFSPRAFEISEPFATPEGVEILVELIGGGDLGFPGDVETREEMTINGWPAIRVESVGVPGGFARVGTRTYAYVIGINGALPSETNTQSYLLVSTQTSLGGDYPLARAIVDELVLRIARPDY